MTIMPDFLTVQGVLRVILPSLAPPHLFTLKLRLTEQDLKVERRGSGWNLLVCGALCWSSRCTQHAIRTKLLNLSLFVIICGLSPNFKIS